MKILITDDDRDLRFNLSGILKKEGYDVIEAGDGREALKMLQDNCPDLVLLDMRLPDIDGMKILEKMKKYDHDLTVIMLTAYSDVKNVVKAMKSGAYDYIGKPFNNDELLMTIKRACEPINLRRELEHIKAQLEAQKESVKVQGDSPAIRLMLKQAHLVAPTSMTVILQGESGVGKEVIANLIHRHSQRHDKPFIPVDCGTIPE
ncbi:MAG: response regulator, partial [Kiritimatiellae bacterium]|nr:response regulator [Kiritimatiellia bacterium]